MADYAKTLLDAARILHQRGYGLLRISPTFYATGHWRCTLTAWDGRLETAADATTVLRYTSALLWDYLGNQTGIENITPEKLADKLINDLPGLDAALGENKAYTWWYNALLQHVGDQGIPYEYAEYDPSWTEGYIGITKRNKKSDNPLDYGFPKAPLF